MISRLIVLLSIILVVALSPAMVFAQYSEASGLNGLPSRPSSYEGSSNCGSSAGYSGIGMPAGYFGRGVPHYRDPRPWLNPQSGPAGNFRDGTY